MFFLDAQQERSLPQIVKLIQADSNTSDKIKNLLPSLESGLNCLKDQKSIVFDLLSKFSGSDEGSVAKNYQYLVNKNICDFSEENIQKWILEFKNIPDKKSHLEEVFSVVLRGIELNKEMELKKEFKLRDTQKLSIYCFLKNNKNSLAQISTGEGKSIIVVAISIIKALMGENVDVITSSSVLAMRDAEENKNIYNFFGIGVAHNCDENLDKRKEAYTNQVVYGEVGDFQRDFLLDRFYNKNILGDRKFENVIVDEVDSMLLDKGNNVLYLSHNLPDLDKLEPVYIYIWQHVSKQFLENNINISLIKEGVIDNLYDFINLQDLAEIDNSQASLIWDSLAKNQIINNKGMILNPDLILKSSFDVILPKEIEHYKNDVLYLLKKKIQSERKIQVPNYLKNFVEFHLENWISSAFRAVEMSEGNDYIVDVDRKGSSLDSHPNIIIVDKDTGTDQSNSQWNEALHQFLQLKHACKISLQSLKAVFISNTSYFEQYGSLYGLTGTLGSKAERELLKEMYKVDFITVPTAKPKLFKETEAIVCNSKEGWQREIIKTTKEAIKDRSVLIICDNINDAEKFYKAFKDDLKTENNLYLYKRDYESFEIAKGNNEIDKGNIIIATNLAGRGTDIKITESLNKAGGLHVCLTYLPSNIRIEQQAFGRAARKGNYGTGQLIIIDPLFDNKVIESSLKILYLKEQRNSEESIRLLEIKKHYDSFIKVEEELFDNFKIKFKTLKSMLETQKSESKEIVLKSFLDKWAFWLDKASVRLTELTKENKTTLGNELCELFETNRINNEEEALKLVKGPTQMVKLGKLFAQKKLFDEAIVLFDDVIREEPSFCESAHYYKAYVLIKKIGVSVQYI